MADRRPPPRKGPAPRPDSGGKPRTARPRREAAPAPRAQVREPEADRLQKFLAHAGVGSRRACEELILQGRVTVDGQVVRELGTKVDPVRQTIAVDGQRVQVERPVYYAVNKPKGYVSTNNDPAGRPRVIDLLPEVPQRVYTVGRLDEMSVGLLLLTNDGELANRLTHPKFGVEKVYRAVVAGVPSREVLDKLVEGVWLAEGKVRAKRVRAVGRKGEATILEMVLAEGKNREVRRMLAKLGHKVMTLTRTAVGPITLKGLKPGQFRPLSSFEVDLLRKVAAGIAVPVGHFGGLDRRAKPPRTIAGGPRRPGRRDDPPPRPSRRAEGQGPSSGPRERRPAGPGPARRPSAGPPRPQAPSRRPQTGPPRPQGPPPSRRPAGSDEVPTRRIIGLPPGPPAVGPRPRRPTKRRPPPGGPGRLRRDRPPRDEGEETG